MSIQILARCPDAALLLASIIPSADQNRQRRNNAFNAQVTRLVSKLRADGKHILLVRMDEAVSRDQLLDGIHPFAQGYRNMAYHWLQTLDLAEQSGWPTTPAAVDGDLGVEVKVDAGKIDSVTSAAKITVSEEGLWVLLAGALVCVVVVQRLM